MACGLQHSWRENSLCVFAYGLVIYGILNDGLFTFTLPGKLLFQGSHDNFVALMMRCLFLSEVLWLDRKSKEEHLLRVTFYIYYLKTQGCNSVMLYTNLFVDLLRKAKKHYDDCNRSRYFTFNPLCDSRPTKGRAHSALFQRRRKNVNVERPPS